MAVQDRSTGTQSIFKREKTHQQEDQHKFPMKVLATDQESTVAPGIQPLNSIFF